MITLNFSNQDELTSAIKCLQVHLGKLPARKTKRSFVVKGLTIELSPALAHELLKLRDHERAMATIQ